MEVLKKRKQQLLLPNGEKKWVQQTSCRIFELNFLLDVLMTMLSFSELLQVRSTSTALQIKWTPKITNLKGKYWFWKADYETTSFFPYIKRMSIDSNDKKHQKHSIVFPPKVKMIDLYNCRLDFDWNSHFLPNSTEILCLPGHITIESWNPKMLPLNLKHLDFGNFYDTNRDFTTLKPLFPSTLMSLTINLGLHPISHFLLPTQLLHLDIRFVSLVDEQITDIVLPPHLQVLKIIFPRNKIPVSFIPTSLQRLYLQSVQGEAIFQDNANLLPSSLYFMKLAMISDTNINASMFPSFLKTLKLEQSISIIQNSYFSRLPCHLQRFSFTLHCNSNRLVFTYDKLPEHLLYFSLKTNLTNFFPCRFLPLGLQILKLGWSAKINFDNNLFLDTHVFLRVFISNKTFHEQTISNFVQKWNGKFEFIVVSDPMEKETMTFDLYRVEKLLQTLV